MSDPADYNMLGAALAGNRHTAVIYADASGAIAFWNAGARALFGYDAAEVAARRIDLIVPEEYRERHWKGFHRAIGAVWPGAEGWGPIPGLHRNGEEIPLEVFLTPVQVDDGVARGVLAFFRRPTPGAGL